MGFTSLDDLVNEVTTNGKTHRIMGSRVVNTGATTAAGRWHECFASSGLGGTGVLTGTAGLATTCDSTTTGALPLNAAVTPDTRHLTTAYIVTNSTVMTPGTAVLIDLLLFYPSCVATGTPTTLNNTATMPTRWGGTLGTGCQIGGVAVTAGFSAANQSYTLTYTNSAGTGSRTATLVAGSNSTPVGGLLGGGVAGSGNTPAAGLQAGDLGVRSIQSYTIGTASTTGNLTLFLYRPIMTIPLIGANVAGERNFLTQLGYPLPYIPDGACLTWLVNVGGATTVSQSIFFDLNMAYG